MQPITPFKKDGTFTPKKQRSGESSDISRPYDVSPSPSNIEFEFSGKSSPGMARGYS